MYPKMLKDTLSKHTAWLRGDPKGTRADLTRANLTRADLAEADLAEADLAEADLAGADLTGADLTGADLTGADLTGANLAEADLTRADLTRADLTRANLTRANLTRADLAEADLTGADLTRANLTRADLTEADLTGAVGVSHLALSRTEIVPREGDFIGWKKCEGGVIVKVRIPSDARRSNATGRKCRAEFVGVLDVIGAPEGISIHDGTTVYRPGETVQCGRWEPNRLIECGGGIHFYLTREEAEAHV